MSHDEDYTKLPGELDRRFLAVDELAAVRALTIRAEGSWRLTSSELNGKLRSQELGADEQKSAKNAALDLLDALSRSGQLGLSGCSLHVLLGHSVGFERSLMDTLLCDSRNPIESAELATLLAASVVHGRPVDELVTAAHRQRVSAFFQQ